MTMATAEANFIERVADALEAELPEGTTIQTKAGTRKAKGYGTITKVSRSKAKQDDLPTMEEHQKKIAEIEDLADIQDELTEQMASLKEKVKEADENLVASMKRHDRTYYSRQTWGSVVLKESKTRAKVTKATAKPSDDSDEPIDE